MRTPRTLARTGLSVAALLVLTACGGSDDASSDAAATSSAAPSTSASAPSSSAAASGDPEDQAFCTEVQQVFTEISNSLDAADPASVATALDQSVAAFDQIEPPAEISSDWDALQQAFAGLRDTVAGVDLNTTEGQTAVQQAVADLETEAAEPQTRIQQYVDTNCQQA